MTTAVLSSVGLTVHCGFHRRFERGCGCECGRRLWSCCGFGWHVGQCICGVAVTHHRRQKDFIGFVWLLHLVGVGAELGCGAGAVG